MGVVEVILLRETVDLVGDALLDQLHQVSRELRLLVPSSDDDHLVGLLVVEPFSLDSLLIRMYSYGYRETLAASSDTHVSGV